MATWELGNIDNSPIGQATPAAGSFTALKASTDPADEHGVGDQGFNDLRYMAIDYEGAATSLIGDMKEENVSAIKKGQMCAITGSSGSVLEVGLCDCNDNTKLRVIGFATTDVAQNDDGQVVYKGFLEGVDTRTSNLDVNPNAETWTAGDLLWVSDTPGGLTNVRPTSGRSIKAGRTVKGNSNVDILLAIVHTNAIWMTSAAGEDVVARCGDDAGINKLSIRNYSNTEVASVKSNGEVLTKTLVMSPASELTISTGAVTKTQTRHNIDTEADAATDDLVTINGGADGHIIIIRAENTARTVVLKHNTGNMLLNGADITLDDTDRLIMLVYDAALTKWILTG